MKYTHYFYASLASIVAAALLFAYHQEYILINYGSHISPTHIEALVTKKNIPLFVYCADQWHQEEIPILTNPSVTATLEQVVNQWLFYAIQEKCIRKIALQQLALSYDGTELFLSFDGLPWEPSVSTFTKWMTIEGLLKTLRTNEPSLKKVYFLHTNQPFNDPHLDFSNPWPIEGFPIA